MNISIIVPVYNVENYLHQCIDSLLNQETGYEYEIICVNDGSTDKSTQILKEYEKRYEKIKIIEQTNKGLSATRNKGIKCSKGKYIVFVDSDDYLSNNNVLDMMCKEMEDNNLDILVADFEYDFCDKDLNYRIKRSEKIKDRIMSGREFYELGLKTHSITSITCNKMYRRDFIIKNNMFFVEGIAYEDEIFTPKVLFKASKVKYVDTCIYMYRQARPGSITYEKSNKNRINDIYIISQKLNELNKEYKSTQLLNQEISSYISILRKIDLMEHKSDKKKYIEMLKNKGLIRKMIEPIRIKYKIYILYFCAKNTCIL